MSSSAFRARPTPSAERRTGAGWGKLAFERQGLYTCATETYLAARFNGMCV